MRYGPVILLAVASVVIFLVLLVADKSASAPEPFHAVAPTMTFAPQKQAWWVRRQIEVATILGIDGDRQGTDPWPNCPDPYDHRGKSWRDTVRCENRAFVEKWGVWDPRAWLDSPGIFRCGLQFEPRWEDRYGKLCP